MGLGTKCGLSATWSRANQKEDLSGPPYCPYLKCHFKLRTFSLWFRQFTNILSIVVKFSCNKVQLPTCKYRPHVKQLFRNSNLFGGNTKLN